MAHSSRKLGDVLLQQRSLRDDDFTWEVLVVDDGSRDRTSEVALRYVRKYTSERVRVLTLAKNRGKGNSPLDAFIVIFP